MRVRQVLGWIAVTLSTLISAVWAWWGSIENFHEGWYYPSLLQNIGLMLIQYLSPMLVSMLLALIAIRWPRVGGGLYALIGVAFGVLLLRRFGTLTAVVSWFWLLVPLLVIAALFWFGRPRPYRLAYVLAVSLPLLVMLGFGTPNAIRVAGRVNDGNFGVRSVSGNGVTLLWAPQGPGWPSDHGATWEGAQQACRYLNQDGLSLTRTL